MSDWDSGDGYVLGGLWDLFGVFGLDLIWVLTPIRADPGHIFICGLHGLDVLRLRIIFIFTR